MGADDAILVTDRVLGGAGDGISIDSSCATGSAWFPVLIVIGKVISAVGTIMTVYQRSRSIR